MATLLCLETATTNCSVALSVNGSVIAFKEDNSKQYSHAENLHVYINDVLTKAGVDKEKLDGVVISKGPGSYTGLRIGVSAAKGLSYALDIPLISVPTLASLASQVTTTGFIVPMLDARRMEVYSAVFDSHQTCIRETKAEILTAASFDEYLTKDRVVFIGNGVEKFQEICRHPNAVFMKEHVPSSIQLAAIASRKYNNKEFEDVAYFEPYYLKDFMKG